MQIKLLAVFKRLMAVIMSFIASLSFCTKPDDTDTDHIRPEANTVSSYSAKEADYKMSVDVEDEIHDISDLLYGVFFEDINFAADGGLYAEKVINRSFEYGKQAEGDSLHGWSAVGNCEYAVEESSKNGLNENNTKYLVMENKTSAAAGVANKGFLEGMSCEENESYNFSVYARGENYKGKLYVRLTAGDKIACEGEISSITNEWKKYDLKLTSSITATENVKLQVLCENGKVYLDMVSLFPENTFKNRENGLRKDLAQMVAELEPKFLRFPGGCVIEGYDYESAYNWKDSIGVGKDGLPLEFNGTYGDVATRSYGINLWTDLNATEDKLPCFMSYGLGFYEYFQFAEDIGAVGVPVLNCGLFCQMRGQGGVDMNSDLFEKYLQDMEDLVEFCRGDVNSTWGKVRASLGHPEPFELKYICIGNENEKEDYFERYEAFLERFLKAKEENPSLYEGLELIYSAGPADATHSTTYLKSYEFAKNWLSENEGYTVNDFAGATDQHYYNEPSWFLENVDHYDEDNYLRNAENMTDTIYGGGIGVFLGEYAAKSNRLEAALAEAAYMTGLERNGDIVKMAAYAPLFGNLTATHWSPNLIWFNNHQTTGSINYYVQKIFSVNQGKTLLSSKLEGAEIAPEELKGRVGLGTWYTSAQFDNVLVTDNETGKVLLKDSFTVPDLWWDTLKLSKGKWRIVGGKLVQKETELSYNEYGASVVFGDSDWSNYTYTFEATKNKGAEGFYIPFLQQDENNMFFWNIGGWDNTQTGLQRMENGVKTAGIPGTMSDFTVEDGKTYKIKIVVDGYNIKGYIDDVLLLDYDAESDCKAEAYQVVSTDESGDVIVKLVNVTDSKKTFAFDISGAQVKAFADVYQVKGNSLDNDNILGAKEDCVMEEFTVEGFSNKFNYTVPQYSVTVIRLHK